MCTIYLNVPSAEFGEFEVQDKGPVASVAPAISREWSPVVASLAQYLSGRTGRLRGWSDSDDGGDQGWGSTVAWLEHGFQIILYHI